MLQHYVLIKYRETTPVGHVEAFCARMLALPSMLDGIERLEIGRDQLHDARSWDLILIMQFQSIVCVARLPTAPGAPGSDAVQRPAGRPDRLGGLRKSVDGSMRNLRVLTRRENRHSGGCRREPGVTENDLIGRSTSWIFGALKSLPTPLGSAQ